MAKYTRYVATDFGATNPVEPTIYTSSETIAPASTTSDYVVDPAPVHTRPAKRRNTALWVAAPLALAAVAGAAFWASSGPDEAGETTEPRAEAQLASAPAPADGADELAPSEPAAEPATPIETAAVAPESAPAPVRVAARAPEPRAAAPRVAASSRPTRPAPEAAAPSADDASADVSAIEPAAPVVAAPTITPTVSSTPAPSPAAPPAPAALVDAPPLMAPEVPTAPTPVAPAAEQVTP